MALSLAPGAAAAQDSTPPQVVTVEFENSTTLIIWFDEAIVSHAASTQFSVTANGETYRIRYIQGVAPGQSVISTGLAVILASGIPEGAVVLVSYTHGGADAVLDKHGNAMPSFRWKVGTGPIPTEAEVYAELEAYFSGTGTLSRVQGVIGQAEGKSYYEKLSEEVRDGRLDRRFDTDERSVVGTDATSGWHQVGTPSVRPGPSDTCGGTTVPGGEGGFETHVSSRYYWNCTQDGQWVPVKVPEPGVDYADDDDLLRPGDDDYEDKCRHRDEDGNPATARRWVVTGSRHVRWNEWTDDDGNTVREEVREPVGHFVESEGNSWDKFAQQCTTRGNP